MNDVPDEQELERFAGELVEASAYMTLATADADGVPWASPVWFAPAAPNEFLWISRPDARHSQNLAARPQLSIVIFDSQVPIGTGQGVYLEAVAAEVPDSEVEQGMAVFSRRSQDQGGDHYTAADVRPPATLRLYRAVASQAFVGSRDIRYPVSLG
jgi:pyridoxine/pyridoxamine 5'-phosphate oxidase